MPPQVVAGAMLQCTFGMAPTSMIVLPLARVFASNLPAANIMDNKPIVNIPTFGMCQGVNLANPAVAAATAAALGVPTPAPCVPVIVAPWFIGAPQVMMGTGPALNGTSKVMCIWLGVISITSPGQFTVQD